MMGLGIALTLPDLGVPSDPSPSGKPSEPGGKPLRALNRWSTGRTVRAAWPVLLRCCTRRARTPDPEAAAGRVASKTPSGGYRKETLLFTARSQQPRTGYPREIVGHPGPGQPLVHHAALVGQRADGRRHDRQDPVGDEPARRQVRDQDGGGRSPAPLHHGPPGRPPAVDDRGAAGRPAGQFREPVGRPVVPPAEVGPGDGRGDRQTEGDRDQRVAADPYEQPTGGEPDTGGQPGPDPLPPVARIPVVPRGALADLLDDLPHGVKVPRAGGP